VSLRGELRSKIPAKFLKLSCSPVEFSARVNEDWGPRAENQDAGESRVELGQNFRASNYPD